MVKVSDVVLIAGMAAMAPASSLAAVDSSQGPEERALAAATQAAPGAFGATIDVEARYLQEDGPESGLVRLILTPARRPLTPLEARAAAQQGFLDALKQRGLADDLTGITVVVRLFPADDPEAGSRESVFRFVRKSRREWAVHAGE